MDNALSTAVQMQFMRPRQLEDALRKFPVVYVPFGLIEWHGPQLPLGNDAIKAHAFLVKTAERFGGVVYPPVFFHEGFGREIIDPVVTHLFGQFKLTGARVIIGITGHNIQAQVDMIQQAVDTVCADGECAGFAGWEVTLSEGPESATDHAAKWETSNMMFFYPQFVDMGELPEGEMDDETKKELGIGGIDPSRHASAEVGRRNVELAHEAIGRKAQELLASLPKGNQGFAIKGINPECWWLV